MTSTERPSSYGAVRGRLRAISISTATFSLAPKSPKLLASSKTTSELLSPAKSSPNRRRASSDGASLPKTSSLTFQPSEKSLSVSSSHRGSSASHTDLISSISAPVHPVEVDTEKVVERNRKGSVPLDDALAGKGTQTPASLGHVKGSGFLGLNKPQSMSNPSLSPRLAALGRKVTISMKHAFSDNHHDSHDNTTNTHPSKLEKGQHGAKAQGKVQIAAKAATAISYWPVGHSGMESFHIRKELSESLDSENDEPIERVRKNSITYVAPDCGDMMSLERPGWSEIMTVSPATEVDVYNISPLTAYCTISFTRSHREMQLAGKR